MNPYREERVVREVVEKHYHFEGLTKGISIIIGVFAACLFFTGMLFWAREYQKTCVDQVQSLQIAEKYGHSMCDPKATIDLTAREGFVVCRCPK